MNTDKIRNFCIIAHIDHGKSTLADRIIELANSLKGGTVTEQVLDDMELERERGITIKLKSVRMDYKDNNEQKYQLNLIDTPGHVDFGYEVSRALAACEGALLLVDATQGVQAQTLVNLEKAKEAGIKILPVVNKIDLPSADLDATALELMEMGFDDNEVTYTSGKTGEGVAELLQKIVDLIPNPKANNLHKKFHDTNTRCLIFDSFYDEYKGVIAFIRVITGHLDDNSNIRFLSTNKSLRLIELGYLAPHEVKVENLTEGEVGYIATGLKNIKDVRVGDTVTLADQEEVTAIPDYEEPLPVVFLSIYPSDSSQYIDLRESVEKLRLSDASFSFEPENSGAIGKGFRCGFLGLLHAEIIIERLEREFNIGVITTSPNVLYKCYLTNGEELEINSALSFPEVTRIEKVEEPWVSLEVFVTRSYMSAVMDLCKERRGVYIEMEDLGDDRLKINYEIPLIEIIVDFYDKLKSISSGYASVNYKIIEYRQINLIKMDVMLAGDIIAPLSQLVIRENASAEGKRLVAKLKELVPRQNFKVAIQASINGKIVAREDIAAVRKDVTAKLYGGDVTRKKKLLEKQKKGKARMKKFGKVDVPNNVFWKIMER